MDVGLVYRDRGEYTRALEIMQESIDLGDEGNAPIPRNYVSPQIGLVYGDLGLCDQGIEIARRTFEQSQVPLSELQQLATLAIVHNHLQCGDVPSAEKAVESWELPDDILAYLGFSVLFVAIQVRLLLECGDLKDAKTLAHKLEDIIHRSGFVGFLPEVLYYKSLVHLALHDEEEARQVLQDALQAAESLGHRRMLWQILAALAEVSPPEEAASLRSQACNVLTFIAEHTPEGELRRSFLAQTRVSLLLEDSQSG